MNLNTKHLLVVGDNPANVELLLGLLGANGFDNVHGLEDPSRMLDYCERHLPDLILLDLGMPHPDGDAALHQLKNRFRHALPPVIAFADQLDDATRQHVLNAGVRELLAKPFQKEDVLQRIRSILNAEHRYSVRDQQAGALERMVAKRARALELQSRTDPITRRLNRRGLTQKLHEHSMTGSGTGLLFIALEGFDDTVRLHGYRTAEKLLRHLAESLEAKLETTDTLGLWGGSELLVITACTDVPALRQLASRLLACFDSDQEVDNLLLTVNARIGTCTAEGAFDSERLIHMAALALPAESSVRVQCYSEEIEARQRHRLHLQQAIRHAVTSRELSLVFQPKLHLKERRIVGAEALLRWNNPRLGMIPPDVFIPLAEASGDILAIGNWVLETAILQAVAWRNQSLLDGTFNIAVNVAARQLARGNFAEEVMQLLQRHDLPPRFFSLEVTESSLMSDLANARSQLTLLADAGIGVAIDDFGTGHSSLAYLKTLPVSTLKIDRTFIMDLEQSATDRRLAETITQLAHGFGCEVVAEGIEEPAQAQRLMEMGCEIGEGYLYSRPLAPADFVRWCHDWPVAHPLTSPETVDGPRPA
ncbi:EAL domain-containing protein [Halomonas sp. Bachu 37]|uniref:GGDEF/EAL domain-containing response regulator n=1 Tax=Halomonas kashgarensis TaxID=3084920 RepID=UPI0032167F0D